MTLVRILHAIWIATLDTASRLIYPAAPGSCTYHHIPRAFASLMQEKVMGRCFLSMRTCELRLPTHTLGL